MTDTIPSEKTAIAQAVESAIHLGGQMFDLFPLATICIVGVAVCTVPMYIGCKTYLKKLKHEERMKDKQIANKATVDASALVASFLALLNKNAGL